MMFGLAAVAFVVGSVFAVRITASIRAPLDAAVKLAHAVAAGDLTARAGVDGHDRSETGLLLRALNDMNDGLVAIVRATRRGWRRTAATSCTAS